MQAGHRTVRLYRRSSAASLAAAHFSAREQALLAQASTASPTSSGSGRLVAQASRPATKPASPINSHRTSMPPKIHSHPYLNIYRSSLALRDLVAKLQARPRTVRLRHLHPRPSLPSAALLALVGPCLVGPVQWGLPALVVSRVSRRCWVIYSTGANN